MPPTIENPQETLAAIKTRAQELQKLQPEIDADTLANPPSRVNVPTPQRGSLPNNSGMLQGVRNNLTFTLDEFQANQTRRNELFQEQQAFAGEGTLSDLFQQQQEQYGIPQNIRELRDIQLQLADRGTANELQKSQIEYAAGQTIGQAQREVTQADREAAIRDAGLAARASVLQGNIETATAAVNQAVNIAYQDRTLRNQNLINQINSVQAVLGEQKSEILEQDRRRYEEDQAAIVRAQNLMDNAVANGYVNANQIESLLKLTDPVVQAEQAQFLIAQGVKAKLDAARAAAASSGTEAPELKNFGTSDNPIWKQWNSQLGTWEEVSGLSQSTVEVENAKQTKLQIDFLLDTTARILGDDEKEYDSLYGAASPNPTAEWVRRNVGSSSTDYTQLKSYAETLRVNVLTMMSDPDIRKFFGPQMTERDAQFMMSAGSTMNVDTQTPTQIKQEVERFESILGQMATQAESIIAPSQTVMPQLAPNETFVQSPIGPVIIVD